MSAAAEYFAQVQALPGWAHILASFLRFLQPAPGWRVIDVGCGPGALARQLRAAGCQAAGIDADAAMVTRAQGLAPGLPFVQGALPALPIPAGAGQAVTATNTLFLLADLAAGLRELARVCRPGGWVAVLNPSPRMSIAAVEAHAAATGLTGFARGSFREWGAQAERHHRWGAAEISFMFQAAGLSEPDIAEKIGLGLALFAKARLR